MGRTPIIMPTDTTPDPRDMERLPQAQQIPTGRSDSKGAAQPDISRRPALPGDSPVMQADVEGEDEDHRVDTGPGVAAGVGQPDGELNRR